MRSIGFLSVCMLAGLSSAAAPAKPAKPAEPAKPALTYLYSAKFSGSAPIDFGATPLGNFSFTPITGGTFSGPKMKGSIVAAGGDWILQDSRGDYHPDVRETFKTDDGAYIQLYQTGSGPQPGGVAYVHLNFVTGSEKYYWLNKAVAVGVLTPVSETEVTLDAWMIEKAK